MVASEKAFDIKMGDNGGGGTEVRMGCCPGGLSVRLPLLSFLPHKIQKLASSNGGS